MFTFTFTRRNTEYGAWLTVTLAPTVALTFLPAESSLASSVGVDTEAAVTLSYGW